LFELGVEDKREEEDVVINDPSAEKEVSHSGKPFKYINICIFHVQTFTFTLTTLCPGTFLFYFNLLLFIKIKILFQFYKT